MKKKSLISKMILLGSMIGIVLTGCSEDNDKSDENTKAYDELVSQMNMLRFEENSVDKSEFDISYVAENCIVFSYEKEYHEYYGVMDGEQNIIQEPVMTNYEKMINGTLCGIDDKGNTYIFDADANKSIIAPPDEYNDKDNYSKEHKYYILDNGNVLVNYSYTGHEWGYLTEVNEGENLFRIYNNKGIMIKEIKNDTLYSREGEFYSEKELWSLACSATYIDWSNGMDTWGYVIIDSTKDYSFRSDYEDTINHKLFLYDCEGNEICTAKDGEGLLKILKSENNEYELCSSFYDGMAKIKNSEGKYGYCNSNGDIVIEAKYEELERPYNGFIAYCEYGNWGFIDYSGEVVIEASYNDVGHFNKGIVPVLKENTVRYIDEDENVIYSREILHERVKEELDINDVSFHGSGYAIITYDAGKSDKKPITAEIIDTNGNVVYSFYNYFEEKEYVNNYEFEGVSAHVGEAKSICNYDVVNGTYWDGNLKNILMVSTSVERDKYTSTMIIKPLICKRIDN